MGSECKAQANNHSATKAQPKHSQSASTTKAQPKQNHTATKPHPKPVPPDHPTHHQHHTLYLELEGLGTVVNLYASVVSSTDETRSGVIIGDGPDLVRVACKGVDGFARVEFPDLDLLV